MAHTIQGRERYCPGQDITTKPTIAIVRERFVKISATHDPAMGENIRIAPCGAGEKAFGVPRHDAAINTLVGVRLIAAGSVMGVMAGAALTFGQQVMSDATGQAIPLTAGNACLGTCVADTAAGSVADIALHY
jgi:predicted phage tail protein